MQKLVASEPAAVACSFKYDRDPRHFKKGAPCALYAKYGKYLLQPECGGEPVGIIIDLIHEHAELSAYTFLTSVAG